MALATQAYSLEQSSQTETVESTENIRTSPIVGKFAGNIYYDEYFDDSVYYDYLYAFWAGYNMNSYLYAQECLEYSSSFMNVLHEWHLVSTRRRYWYELWDLFFEEAGTDANDTWYNCFLFYSDIREAYKQKFENFDDFGDLYLSFIFNMLQNSYSIKQQTDSMIENYAIHDTEKFT